MVQETAEENITIAFSQNYLKQSFGELFIKVIFAIMMPILL